MYHEHGAFEAQTGTPPESTFARIKNFLLALEGIFRMLPANAERSDRGVTTALASVRLLYNTDAEFIRECIDSAIFSVGSKGFHSRGQRAARRDGEGENAADSGWPLYIADMVSRISGPLQKELLDERHLLRFLVEWCNTPSKRQPGVAYSDCCLLYDQGDELCRCVQPSPHNNIYMRIPHPLRDPVLEESQRRLERFYATTFWCN